MWRGHPRALADSGHKHDMHCEGIQTKFRETVRIASLASISCKRKAGTLVHLRASAAASCEGIASLLHPIEEKSNEKEGGTNHILEWDN